MIRKIHSLRPVPFPSLSIYSSAPNSIDITCTSTSSSNNTNPSTTSNSASSIHQQHMVRMVGGAATAISSLKKKDTSGLVHQVISKQKNNFVFNTFISLDALATPPPKAQREEFHHSSKGSRPPLKKKEGLTYPTIEISQQHHHHHRHHEQNSMSRGNDKEPRERIWFDILPLPYHSSFGIVEKNVNFFVPEYENPFLLKFIDQEEGTKKKVVCFPSAVALRERSSGVVFLGGTSSCLQVFTFPHLNLPLLFFPPPPSSLSASESPNSSNSEKNRFEFLVGKSEESSDDVWADAVDKTEPPSSKIQRPSTISEELANNNKSRVPLKKHAFYLAHLTNHVRLVDATAERVANHFFATNENLLKYSGNSKLVCVSNVFLDVHDHEESLLPSSVIVKDGFEALRQVRVICAALQEALLYVRSELKNIESEVSSKFVADDLTRKRSIRNHATSTKGEEDEIRKMRAMLDERLAQDVISLWETAFCRVLDAHIRERGSMISLLNILTMSNRLPHTRNKNDDNNDNETKRNKKKKKVVGKEEEEIEIDERKLLPRASSVEMKLADMTLFAQLIKSWTQL